jgi:hypothetical protein
MKRFVMPQGNASPAMGQSRYREYIFDKEALSSLQGMGLTEAQIAGVINTPEGTRKDEEGNVVAWVRDHSTGAYLLVHHSPTPDGNAVQGEVRAMDTEVKVVRLEANKGARL